MPFTLRQFPEYPFAKLLNKKRFLQSQGKTILDLSTGICPIGAPAVAIQAMSEKIDNPKHHQYSFYNGRDDVREAVSHWFDGRFSVALDPVHEITMLSGTKEGLSKIGQAIVRADRWAIICDPAYPVYEESVLQAGGLVYMLPLRKENNFLPDFSEIPLDVIEKCDAIFLNFPHNPTGTVLPPDFITELESLVLHYDLRIVYDMAYSEIYRKTPPFSLLSVESLRDRTVEFHSFSKNYGMTGFRIGFAVGNRDIIRALVNIKSTRGSSIFEPIQYAARAILLSEKDESEPYRIHCTHNRKIWEDACDSAHIEYEPNQAGYFLWATIPKEYKSSEEYADFLLEKLGILAVPGSFLGSTTAQYIRFSIAGFTDVVEAAAQRIIEASEQ